MAYPIASVVSRVRSILQDYPWETTSSSDPGLSGTTFTVPDGTKWAEGDIAEFQDNGEQVRVTSVSSNTLTVARGFNGTTAQSHGVGTRLLKNPVFTYKSIRDKVEATMIADLWPWAWTVEDLTRAVPTPTTAWVDGSATMIDLISVRQLFGSDLLGEYGDPGGRSVIMRRNLPTTLVASGVGLLFPNGVYHTSNSIFIKARRLITAAISGSDYSDLNGGVDVETVVYGAAAKLVADKEVERVTQQDLGQGERTVQPLSRLRAAGYYEAEFRAHLNNWYAQLMVTIPPMPKWY